MHTHPKSARPHRHRFAYVTEADETQHLAGDLLVRLTPKIGCTPFLGGEFTHHGRVPDGVIQHRRQHILGDRHLVLENIAHRAIVPQGSHVDGVGPSAGNMDEAGTEALRFAPAEAKADDRIDRLLILGRFDELVGKIQQFFQALTLWPGAVE